jgi:uncharacterized phage protein (TIGR01671 family)
MREIKFRGQSIVDGKWVQGNLLNVFDGTVDICYFENVITDAECNHYEPILQFVSVKPETVGEFTGLQDKNGTDIYEGDLVTWRHLKDGCVFEVYYNEKEAHYFGKPISNTEELECYLDSEKMEATANIHDK